MTAKAVTHGRCAALSQLGSFLTWKCNVLLFLRGNTKRRSIIPARRQFMLSYSHTNIEYSSRLNGGIVHLPSTDLLFCSYDVVYSYFLGGSGAKAEWERCRAYSDPNMWRRGPSSVFLLRAFSKTRIVFWYYDSWEMEPTAVAAVHSFQSGVEQSFPPRLVPASMYTVVSRERVPVCDWKENELWKELLPWDVWLCFLFQRNWLFPVRQSVKFPRGDRRHRWKEEHPSRSIDRGFRAQVHKPTESSDLSTFHSKIPNPLLSSSTRVVS